MAPVLDRLRQRVDEIVGVIDGTSIRASSPVKIDVALICFDRVRAHRPPARRLSSTPSRVSSEGAVELHRAAPRRRCSQPDPDRRLTPESATSLVPTKVLLPDVEQVPWLSDPAEAKLLIGDAPRCVPRPTYPTPHDDLGRLWLKRTAC